MSEHDESVAGIRQSLAMAVEELGRAQASLSAAQDRTDAVRQIAQRVMQGSSREQVSVALAGLADMKEDMDQALAASLLVKEQIDTYAATL